MTHRILRLPSLLLLLCSFVNADVTVYRATLQPTAASAIPNDDVEGFVALFTESGTLSLGYAGIVEGLESDLQAAFCNATNGCGVHIHNGTSCDNSTTQGGHYYTGDVTEDPWIDARYSSDADGKANFQGLLNIGTIDIEGRVFLVHSENGTRIGCGVIESVDFNADTQNLLSTNTLGLTDADVVSIVTAYAVNDGIVCYFGSAKQLEPDLLSYLNPDILGGTDCNFTNGCGVHIHNGTACTDKATQGGHLYNTPEDPWLYTMYHATDELGDAQFAGCVETGVEESLAGYPFIVHSNNGTRVSCGILESVDGSVLPPASPPVGPPAFAPTASAAPQIMAVIWTAIAMACLLPSFFV